MEMERSEWIWGLCVLVVALLRFVGGVGRDGGERDIPESEQAGLLVWCHPALCLCHSTADWPMKISNCVIWAVVVGSWNGICMRSKSNYMSAG